MSSKEGGQPNKTKRTIKFFFSKQTKSSTVPHARRAEARLPIPAQP